MKTILKTPRMNELETLPRCVLCGEDQKRFRPFGRKSGYRLDRCGRCGLVFINPRDQERVVLHQYLENQTSPVAYYEATKSEDEMNFKRLFDAVSTLLPKGRLLDIGSNVGTFLESAKERGWTVEGIEANRTACEACRKKNLSVTPGIFGKGPIPGISESSFDWVAMNDTIEHFFDPLSALREASRLIRKGGMISVLTPNLRSLLGRIFQIKPKEHLFYFDPGTLRRILEEAGLNVVRLEEWPRPRNVGAMHLGATFENPLWGAASKFLELSRLDTMVNFILQTCFREQIFALAQKI